MEYVNSIHFRDDPTEEVLSALFGSNGDIDSVRRTLENRRDTEQSDLRNILQKDEAAIARAEFQIDNLDKIYKHFIYLIYLTTNVGGESRSNHEEK